MVLHNNNWLNGLVKLEVQTTIKSLKMIALLECSTIIRKYRSSPMHLHQRPTIV